MKRCPQCNQFFSDENSFCLSDGTPLFVPIFDRQEETTVIRPSPFIQQLPSSSRQGVNPMFAYLAFGLLALLFSGAIVLWLKSSSNTLPLVKSEIANTTSNYTESNSNKEQPQLSKQKTNLQEAQESLDREKQKLADERKKLEVEKNKSREPTTFSQTSSYIQPTARIKFGRGSVEETISGNIGVERSFVLYTLSGQYLSATVSSGNGCVVFTNGSTNTNYTTSKGDSYLRLKNNCGSGESFNLTVYIR